MSAEGEKMVRLMAEMSATCERVCVEMGALAEALIGQAIEISADAGDHHATHVLSGIRAQILIAKIMRGIPPMVGGAALGGYYDPPVVQSDETPPQDSGDKV